MKRGRILFYCQPVLGMGHLVRSLAILRGLSDFETWLINGGVPLSDEVHHLIPAGLKTIDLPPLLADPEFTRVAPVDPEADLQHIREIRQQILLETLKRIKPDILMIELYPFGRLKFDSELQPLLEAARRMRPAPRVVCSLRDILVAKRDQSAFEEFAVARSNQFFDLILIHSDPTFQSIDETFQSVARLTCPVRYTGYVVPAPSIISCPPIPEAEPAIVASIGGGRVGAELLATTIAASRRLHTTRPHRLRIFTGPYLPEDEWQKLVTSSQDAPWVSIARFTPTLSDEIRSASVSVSMAGYNTCLDLLLAQTPAIVYPYTGNSNDEQLLRARKLESIGAVKVLTIAELTPDNLAFAICGLLNAPLPRPDSVIDLSGVATTAQLICEILD